MNKTELVTEMETRFNGTVIDQGSSDVENGYNTYNWLVKVIKGMSSNVLYIPVIVFDDGGAGEDAYYRDGIPIYPRTFEGIVNESSNLWRDAVKAELASRKAAGTGGLKTARIDWVDEEDRIAKVTGYFDVAGDVEEREALIFEDNTSTLSFVRIVVS